ncbi:MAG: hypothetical protein AAFP04_10115 [Myxococcota bacterium]
MRLKSGWIFRLVLSASVPFALVACGSDEPTAEDYDDVAAAVAPLVVGDNGDTASMDDALSVSTGDLAPGLTRSGEGSVRGSRGGVSYSYDVSCLDGAGDAQTSCNSETDTASVNVAWDGDFNTLRYDTSLSRTGSWTLTGITGATAVLDGEGTFDVDSEFQSLDGNRRRTYMLSYAAEYEGVLIDTATRQAVGGRAFFEIAADRTASNRFRDVEASFDIEADVTFNDDGSATLILDGERIYELESNSSGVEVSVNPS